MMTFNLALRNLLRNRRRSLATLVAMSIGCAAILLFGGFSGNINYEMHTRIVQRGGHLQIQHRDFYLYGSGNPTAYGIDDYGAILHAIDADPELRKMVTVATPSLQFGGIAGNYAASVSRTVIGTGFVAGDVNRMRLWNDFALRSKAPVSALEGTGPDAAVVGVGVARVLQLCDALKIERCPKPETERSEGGGKALPDDIAQLSALETPSASAAGNLRRIEVLVVNSKGAPNVTSLEVVRAEDQGVKELDEVSVSMHLEKIQQLVYGKSAPKVTSIILQLRHSDQVPEAVSRLKPILDRFSTSQPLAVQDFRDLNPFFVQTVQMFDTIFGFVFILIGAIVLFTVSNTMNTAVVERTVEIGTLRAIGLRRSGIRRLFVTEGTLLGVFGALLGVVLAFLVSWMVNRMHIPWVPPSTVEPVPLTILVAGETRMIVGTTLGLICIAIASAWWPSYRAAQMKVVDALRHV
ncbi:MAG: FtsX-like permease family protein [Burkholderiaceae bacterium]|uniref:ABC transporter permease n=1 Tax=Hydrogenophaga sp. TaxID=1904254 RepID=UPI00262D55C3|nr:FtsX-like permease family protein [Hydrogenophaga sp.]MCW5668897.1 ABC transporter permease [Hydrogenophaga sp.]